MLQADWIEQYTYPTNEYYKFLQNYCNAFKKLFRCELKVFTYEQCMRNGLSMDASNVPQINEIYFESEGYKDNPYFVEYDFVQPGSLFSGPGYASEYECHNLFKTMLQKKFGIDTTFGIREKTQSYYCDFCWDFKAPPELNIQQLKTIILEDYVTNYSVIQAIISQFKIAFFPIIEKEELCNVSRKDISMVYNKDNYITNQNTRTNDPNFLSNTNLIQANDLKLMQVKFSKLEDTILNLYTRGMTADEIGNQISRSRKTIESYIARIKDKIGCNKRSEVYEMAEKLKLMRTMSGIS